MQRGVCQTYSSWPVLSQEALHVSSCHQLQQDETWQDVQTDADAAHDVVMAELAVLTNDTYVSACVCKSYKKCVYVFTCKRRKRKRTMYVQALTGLQVKIWDKVKFKKQNPDLVCAQCEILSSTAAV